MKILIVGENKYPMYEEAFNNAFISLGLKSKIFGWKDYFKKDTLFEKIQNKFIYGPIVTKINKELLQTIHKYQPDLIFLHRANFIYNKTLIEVKSINKNIKIFCYHNDDPFSEKTGKLLNRHYLDSLKNCDWIFSYRLKNINDYNNIGYQNTSLLRSYYIKENNYHIENAEKTIDVLFIGHFENDGRDNILQYLIDNKINVKIYGTGWEKSEYYHFFLEKGGEIKPIYGEKYNITINQAKIALVFLSKINNDTYTRRCFEIPVTKTAMFCEHTEDIANNLYINDKEVILFKNKEDLLLKTKKYLASSKLLLELTENCHTRLLTDGHEVTNRAEDILTRYKILQGVRN